MDLEGSGDIQEYLNSLHIIGEFSPLGVDKERKEIVPLELCLTKIKFDEYYVGEMQRIYDVSSPSQKRFKVDIAFNQNPSTWKYSWQGSKYRTETKHAFVVSVLSPKADAASDLLRLASFESPSFVIGSSRRKKLTRSECVPSYTPGDNTSIDADLERTRKKSKLALDGPFCMPACTHDIGGQYFAKLQTEDCNCSLTSSSEASDESNSIHMNMSEAAYQAVLNACCMQVLQLESASVKHGIDPVTYLARFGLKPVLKSSHRLLSTSRDCGDILYNSDAYDLVFINDDTSPYTSIAAEHEGGDEDLEVKEKEEEQEEGVQEEEEEEEAQEEEEEEEANEVPGTSQDALEDDEMLHEFQSMFAQYMA